MVMVNGYLVTITGKRVIVEKIDARHRAFDRVTP
jgi:hypothetical protein